MFPAVIVAEIAREDRRMFVERDLGEPAAQNRFAYVLGQLARALGLAVDLVHPGLERRDGDRILDRGIDEVDRKSTRLNSSHTSAFRMPSSACKKKRRSTS